MIVFVKKEFLCAVQQSGSAIYMPLGKIKRCNFQRYTPYCFIITVFQGVTKVKNN